MAYQVLYRKYRPNHFDEVVGQDYVIKTLLNAIKMERISHAYLFSGPRGTGKTTIAKLFAKTINCSGDDKPCGKCDNCKALEEGTHPDVIELDAASNNSVDDIREIVEKANYRPIMGKYKIYILDEVHMLTQQAANALLKTLEEPPEHVIFILATTDPQKIIPTIISRCQRYNFFKVNPVDMKRRMSTILDSEKIEYEEKALDALVDLSDGCLRDALSMLDEALAYGNYKLEASNINKMFGLLSIEKKIDLIKDIKNHKIDDAIVNVKTLYLQGIDIKLLTQDLIKLYKDILVYKDTKSENLLSSINADEANALAEIFDSAELLENIDILVDALEKYRLGQDPFSYFEIVILKLANHNIRKKEEVSYIFDEEVKENPKAIKDEVKLKEEIKLNLDEIVLTKENLLYLLKSASKEEKNKDVFIYQKLREYSFDPDKRKFFALLKDTEIFADNKDTIILQTYNDSITHQINDKMNNQELYYFILDEFGIDKTIYAINMTLRNELADSFRRIDDYDLKEFKLERYPEREKIDITTKLQEVFGDIEIREE